jgi:hypothetical protein
MNRTWLLGFLVGVLFGLFIALGIIDEDFHASADVKRWIGNFGFYATMLFVLVNSWLPSKDAAKN